MERSNITDKLNKWSAAEVADLLSVGYRVQIHARTMDGGYIVRLRHCFNGNIMLLETRPDGYTLRKNGRMVKTVTANPKT